MNVKKMLGVLCGLALYMGSFSAQAASVSLLPDSQSGIPGGTLALDLVIDFSDIATVGGRLDIAYDASVLSFESWVWDSTFYNGTATGVSDPAFTQTPSLAGAGDIQDLAFGSFAGINASYLVGTLTFNVLASAPIVTSLVELMVDPVFVFSDVTGNPIAVDLNNGEVIVTPLPAAAWLMLAGLGFLVGFGRRKMGAT